HCPVLIEDLKLNVLLYCFHLPLCQVLSGLSYDREDLHRKHLRARRATQPQEFTLQLDFTAFRRAFQLRLKRSAAGFSEHFEVVSENGRTAADLSHLYSGTLEGAHGSACHGSVIQGQFEGSIHTDNGTFYIEPVHRYTTSETDHHSIIYHEDDMGNNAFISLTFIYPGKVSYACCLHRFFSLLQASYAIVRWLGYEALASRSRRTPDESKTSCLLHLHADHLYFKKSGTNFGSNDISQTRLHTFIFRPFIGPEKLLSLFSESNWGNYCLSYLLTNRDYSGVLGLAWEGKAGNWGGICSKYTTLRDGRNSSLNTGLITIQNYGYFLPPRHVQLTLAHELGHSLGSPVSKGRYLMFPHATDEVRENNDKFSPCSIKHISKILRLKKDECFVVSDQPICGNQIVEENEECDIGHNDTDLCCYSAKEPVGVQCHLKPGKVCSPSQGLCCGQNCMFKPAGETCDEETDCQKTSLCSGLSPFCPDPSPKDNLTVCSQGTRVCLNGACAESVCVKHGLQQCDCPGVSMKEKCHMCCQQPGNHKPETCASTTSSVLSLQFQKKRVPLVPGAPCSGNQGYCDKFQVCRLLDADGPIARLKNSFLKLDDFEDLAEWMKVSALFLLVDLVTKQTKPNKKQETRNKYCHGNKKIHHIVKF
uniref:ADAM10 endopeptidase n=1 Tax=Myripristis murdjan TaxID=586833 RepID=A0A667YMM8_9TELE